MSRIVFAAALAVILLSAPAAGSARVIGTNVPAQGLTAERIAALPAGEREAWAAYLARSEAQWRVDQATLAAELAPGQRPPPPPVAANNSLGRMPLDRAPGWYGSAEARAIAENILSFQTPAGGWSKNQNRSGPPRLRGQRYANNAETMDPDPADFDAPRDRFWTFVGTLDNGATTTEMRFLGKVVAQTPARAGDTYRASFLKGVNWLLGAQYPNGGWPQVWPLEGGFHDAVTFNDNATAEAAMLLEDVGEGDFPFVPAELRARAREASRRAVDVILAAQLTAGGRPAGWPQQVDVLTLKPTSARNYEPLSIASAETADILIFLMRQPGPSPEIRRAIRGGISWLLSTRAYGKAFTMTEQGRKLTPQSGAGPLWSRNYDIATGIPIFGDRDKSIHDDVNDISLERRNNYSWWTPAPQRALDAYVRWSRANPE